MAAREGRIASQLAAAQQKRQDAEEEEASLRRKIRSIEDQRLGERRWPKPGRRRKPISRSSSPRPGRNVEQVQAEMGGVR